MSDKSSTFAPEIGKDVLTILRRKRIGQRWGATREEYGAVKHIPRMRGERTWDLYRFRVSRSFVFSR